MSKRHYPHDEPTGPPDLAKNQITEPFRICLEALADAIEREIRLILERVNNHALQAERALEGITLISRREAADKLGISLSSLDRKVASGEIIATYLDEHPRFRISELARFIEARSSPPRNRSRQRS